MDPSAPAKQNKPDWSSGLPKDVLDAISKKLISPIDLQTFRSICEEWRSCAQSLRFAPLLMFPVDPHNDTLTFYSPSDKTKMILHVPQSHNKVICGSSHGCIALMDEMGGVSLLNPFTHFQANVAPADEEIASASLYEVIKQDGHWMIKYNYNLEFSPVTKPELRKVFFEDILLLSPPTYDGDNFVAVGMLGSSTQIAFCKKEDPKWTLIETKLSSSITSIACYNDKIFVMDFIGRMAMCDISNKVSATLLPNMNTPPDTHRWKLVASEEGFFLVALTFEEYEVEDMFVLEYSTVVYRADFSTDEPYWCKVESIGSELSMFVSKSSNSNFVGKNISGCEGECIYFSSLLCNNDGGENSLHSIEIAPIPGTGSDIIVETLQGHLLYSDVVSWFRPNLLLTKE